MANIWADQLLPPLDPDSAALSARLAQLARMPDRPANWGGGIPVYDVDDSVPPVRVTLRVRHNDGTYTGPAKWQRSLQDVLDLGVPLPAGFRVQGNRDKKVIVEHADGRLWELWHCEIGTGTGPVDLEGEVYAQWGGAALDCWGGSGAFDDDCWLPYSEGQLWGVSASGTMMLPGLIRFEEFAAGNIEHAIRLELPEIRAEVAAWPCNRTDGHGGADSIPYGAHFFLDPEYDEGLLSANAQVICRAWKKRGMVVADQTPTRGGEVKFTSEAQTGVANWVDLIGDSTHRYKLMQELPWEHLHLLPMELKVVS